MSLTLNSSQREYIILTQNKINENNEGTKLLMSTNAIIRGNGVFNQTIQNLETKNIINNVSNLVIINFNTFSPITTPSTITSNCLITQNNIKNNIKFIFTDSTKNGKLVFIKNYNAYSSYKNYLISITSSNFNSFDSSILYKQLFHLNYYFNNINTTSNFYSDLSNSNPNYDYYKLNMKDYLTRDFSSTFFYNHRTDNDICYNLLDYKITTVSPSDYSNNLYIDSDVSFRKINSISNISNLRKQYNIQFPIYNNIYNLYNDYNKIINYDVNVRSISGNTIKTLSINFDTFLIKKYNVILTNNIQSKIVFESNNTIYFSNVKVSTPQTPINFDTKDFYPYIIYLSLGNNRTGLTQSDIYSHSASTPTMEQIYFRENITSSVINTQVVNVEKKHNTLISAKSNKYLYDIELSSNKLLKTHTINTINTNSNKIFPINFSKLFNINELRSYYNNFNNIAFTSISGNVTSPDISYFTRTSNTTINSISFDILDVTSEYLYSRSLTNSSLKDSFFNFFTPAFLDVRFNYNSYFYLDLSFNILYNSPSPYPNSNSIKNINNYFITVACLIYTTPARDFTDIECIYIYHNPDTETDPSYRYPYNNIEIIRDPSNIDTLSKAIELLPGARTSTTNTVIIPEKNGSNLSRKMIQGLIGLNNIPKLLSIKPYDENSIVGRGFINQYQIDNICISGNEEIIKNKINANKHSSAKDNRRFTENKLEKQNFANLVRSNRRNRLSQQCIENLRDDIRNNNPVATQVNYANIVPYTPRFKIFKTGQGHYL